MGVALAFISREVATRGDSVGQKLLQRVLEIASDIAAARVFRLYTIEPLEAVPLGQLRTATALHKVRWPPIRTDLTRKPEAMRRLAAKVSDRGR